MKPVCSPASEYSWFEGDHMTVYMTHQQSNMSCAIERGHGEQEEQNHKVILHFQEQNPLQTGLPMLAFQDPNICINTQC